MSDLDKRLHDLLLEQAKSYYFEGSSEEWFEEECPALVEKFKQAFKDAGWMNTGLSKQHMEQVGWMSGKDWFNRFEKEMGAISAYATFDNHDDVDRALGAAKRASVLEAE